MANARFHLNVFGQCEANLDQMPEFAPQSLEFLYPVRNSFDVIFHEIHHVLTGRFFSITKGQYLFDVLEGEIEGAGAADEA
jgi:hypothetical protein